jgi:hypothetical protein
MVNGFEFIFAELGFTSVRISCFEFRIPDLASLSSARLCHGSCFRFRISDFEFIFAELGFASVLISIFNR